MQKQPRYQPHTCMREYHECWGSLCPSLLGIISGYRSHFWMLCSRHKILMYLKLQILWENQYCCLFSAVYILTKNSTAVIFSCTIYGITALIEISVKLNRSSFMIDCEVGIACLPSHWVSLHRQPSYSLCSLCSALCCSFSLILLSLSFMLMVSPMNCSPILGFHHGLQCMVPLAHLTWLWRPNLISQSPNLPFVLHLPSQLSLLPPSQLTNSSLTLPFVFLNHLG